jgi:hypothetical protein
MDTLDNNIENKPSKDPIDKLIYEKNFRIKMVLPVKAQDSLIVFLNNGKHISVHLSSFSRLKKAGQKQLDAWELISNGIGIEWPEIDEDLSLKGLLQQFITENTIGFLTGGENTLAKAA